MKTYSKPVIWVCAALVVMGLIGAIVYYFVPSDADYTNTASIQPSATPGTQTASAALPMHVSSAIAPSQIQQQASLSLEQRLKLINQRNPNLHMTQSQLLALMNKPSAWQVQDEVANQLLDKLEPGELEDGRRFIQVNPMKIETLQPNDTMSVNIPQMGKDFTLKINDISTEDGITSWNGVLTDFEDLNTVSITQGGTGNSLITQIGLNTPSGFYVLEGFGNVGWIVPGGTKFNKGEIVIPVDENGQPGKPEIYPVDGSEHSHSHEH